MSLTLLIDSVHAELAVALVNDDKSNDSGLVGGSAVFRIFREQRQHDKNLNRLVTQLLKQQKVKFTDIDKYAVVVGPGSWTGCRVGVAAIKGYNAAHPRPIIALNSLDALGDPSAINSNLDNYYIKRGNKYSCEKLTTAELSGYSTLDTITHEGYRTRLIAMIKKVKPITAKELTPFYITDFQVKT